MVPHLAFDSESSFGTSDSTVSISTARRSFVTGTATKCSSKSTLRISTNSTRFCSTICRYLVDFPCFLSRTGHTHTDAVRCCRTQSKPNETLPFFEAGAKDALKQSLTTQNQEQLQSNQGDFQIILKSDQNPQSLRSLTAEHINTLIKVRRSHPVRMLSSSLIIVHYRCRVS